MASWFELYCCLSVEQSPSSDWQRDYKITWFQYDAEVFLNLACGYGNVFKNDGGTNTVWKKNTSVSEDWPQSAAKELRTDVCIVKLQNMKQQAVYYIFGAF